MSTTETQAVPAGTWAVDPVHSTIGFAVGYMAGTFTGTFSDFDALVTDGVLTGSAKVASVQVKDPNLEAHLQSPDFFDADRHPELTFEPTRSNATASEFGSTARSRSRGTPNPSRSPA
jgi:polyisoprenoid-binding protein YceI